MMILIYISFLLTSLGVFAVYKYADAKYRYSMVQAWCYVFGFLLLQYFSVNVLISLASAYCLMVFIMSFVDKKAAKKVRYKLAREHLGLFLSLWFITNVGIPYFKQAESVMIDFSHEAALGLFLYTLLLGCVCIYERYYNKNFSWKRDFTRGWYYAFLIYILSRYGVEFLLLTAFILTWLGFFLSYVFVNFKNSVASELVRENIYIITLFWVVRSFIMQPFIVPTGSLEPTVLPGDFVLVNQYIYGLRFPVWGWKLLNVSSPKRGDIAVFRFPPNPDILFVKRVIGLPGDHVIYSNDTLTINDVEIKHEFISKDITLDNPRVVDKYSETLAEAKYKVYLSDENPYKSKHWEWQIPEGKYLMLGDNRQGSNDSRFWGLVDERLLVGKAEYIIFSINKKELPSIRFRYNRWLRSIYASD